MTRQARHNAAQRAAAAIAAGREPGTRGRPRWHCPTCGGTDRRTTSTGDRLCRSCFPTRRAPAN